MMNCYDSFVLLVLFLHTCHFDYFALTSLLDINLFVFLCLFIVLPSVWILFHSVHFFMQYRHNICQIVEQRKRHESNKAWLGFSHICSSSVAQHADRKSSFFFQVALLEELFEQEVGPIFNCFKISGWNAYVTGMETVFKHNLLILEKLRFVLYHCKFIKIMPFFNAQIS